ncbi:hypothetical protein [Sporotomaculum syntrophicum]|uniref:hypothetical protein n=1 Tax=Sporotomaculum syntrophicum TaxID=182264 RepID=UPI0013798049|nr:hypothetical protein [Sporotomaculum syntrophicum]
MSARVPTKPLWGHNSPVWLCRHTGQLWGLQKEATHHQAQLWDQISGVGPDHVWLDLTVHAWLRGLVHVGQSAGKAALGPNLPVWLCRHTGQLTGLCMYSSGVLKKERLGHAQKARIT